MSYSAIAIQKRAMLVLFAGLGVIATAASLNAQAVFSLTQGTPNIIRFDGPPQPGPTASPVPTQQNDPTYSAYQVQWHATTAFDGWLTHQIKDSNGTVLAGASDLTVGAHPTILNPSFQPKDNNGAVIPNQGVQLTHVRMARPLVLFNPSYALGSEIPPPAPVVINNISYDFFAQPANAYTDPPTNSIPNSNFYWSPHAQKVYATQPGVIVIQWKNSHGDTVPQTYVISTAPVKPARKIFWTENGFNGPPVQVPASRVSAVNIVYNAQFHATVGQDYDQNHTPAELRTLWYDQVQQSIRAYNAEGRVFLEYLGNLKADGVTREQLGYEIVEVVKEVRPTTLHVDLGDVVGPQDGASNPSDLTAVIIAGLGLSSNPYLYENITQGGTKHTLYAIRATAPGVFINGLEQQTGNEVLIYWEEAGVLGIKWPKYYDGYVQAWPSNQSKFSLYVRPDAADGDSQATGVPLDSSDNPTLVYQSDPSNQQAAMLPGNVFYANVGDSDPSGMALIRYTNGDDIWFERVFFQRDSSFLSSNQNAPIGERINPPNGADTTVGYIRQTAGTAFDEEAYIDPFAVGFDQAKAGAIIPVNNLPSDKLEVWWFKRSSPPGTKISSTYWPQFVSKYTLVWPSGPGVPEIVLASNAGSGDLPSLQATGKIYYQNNSAMPGFNPNEEHALMLNGRAWALRDDLNVPDPVQSGKWTSSAPYVLVSYTEADQRPAMVVFRVLREKPGNPGIKFNYPGVAGVILQAPMPLPLLPIPRYSDPSQANYNTPYNYEVDPADPGQPPPGPADPASNFTSPRDKDYARYQNFTYVDRKATHWIYRGPHGAGTPTFSMRYYYLTQPGFYFPGLSSQPAVGTPVPYLRPYKNPAFGANSGFAGDENPLSAVTGTPLNIVFRPQWPAAVPQMLISQTLTLPTQGLPAIRGQSSAKVIYQQSIARNMNVKTPSARLYDPTRAKTFPLGGPGMLDAIPSSINTYGYIGKTYFPNLPPHLSQRLYFDPTIGASGALVLLGQFIDDPVGDKYVLLNILSAADKVAAKGLCAGTDPRQGNWNAAIDGLQTTMETFKENPNKRGTFIPDVSKDAEIGVNDLAEVFDDMTAVDSYAMAASGGGQGYVVVATGDSHDTDFTPPGEPVSLQIFQVTQPLNRGQLKVVSPSNPLDEKLTLQHSGDFAGHPEDYEFEWKYLPPNGDGSAPLIYSVQRTLLIGDSGPTCPGSPGAQCWELFQNPGANYPSYRGPNADLTGGSAVRLPVSLMINDGNGSADNGTILPYAVLRQQFTFTGAERPLRLFVSLGLGTLDGAIVYVNGAQVVTWNVAGSPSTSPTTSPGNAFQPLPYLFEIPPAALLIGANTPNTITVQLYTAADAQSTSPVNVRLEAAQGTDNSSSWVTLTGAGETLMNRYVIGGSGLMTLTDNYYTMHYRAKPNTPAFTATGGAFSKWTDPQLAEGWIKRALAGINPFQQRVTDLFNNTVDTQVSLVEQAGKRWEGNIPLNLQNINDFGLIEIYETILRRGESLSINGNPPINYGGANDALLLVGGYLNDLYNILGNEAFADAADPTIAVGTSDNTFGNVATSLFAFKGEVASLAEEELDLLRGRDDFLQPGTQTAPVYNRLYWNYTRGIDSGEAIYALNYNIKDLNKDGAISAADAAVAYPQGHGDAYGHYLTALTGYYGLLHNSHFSWTPRTESVLVLGLPVQVDYFDERKFAATAASLASTASQVLDLTYRQSYSATETPTWSKLRDGKTNNSTGRVRSWGVDEWAARGGQGAYFNWIVANSLLPAVDPNPNHQGIQIIDRTTVPELAQIVAQGNAIEKTLENADTGFNPLGLSKSAFAFDISPSDVDQGKTHYEQIYQRAVAALQNAVIASNNAVGSTLALRAQEDNVDTERQTIDQQEQVFTNELVELYGTPYSDDIGPGRTFAQGYSGPDLLHFLYVDMPELFIAPTTNETSTGERTYVLELDPTFDANYPGMLDSHGRVSFTFNGVGDNAKPAAWTGHRATPGRMQTAVSNVVLARQNLRQNLSDYSNLVTNFERQLDLYRSRVDTRDTILKDTFNTQIAVKVLQTLNTAESAGVRTLDSKVADAQEYGRIIAEYFPKVSGIDNDATSTARGAGLLAAQNIGYGLKQFSLALQVEIAVNNAAIGALNSELAALVEAANWSYENKQLINGLQTSLTQLVNQQRGVDAALRRMDQASRDLSALQAEGDRIQQERQTYRQRAAAIVQGYRVKDFAFRAFRNEALEKYKTLFELAARYTYLAARAYDYETGLLNADGNSTAAQFFEGIIQSRALGVVSNGQPQFAGSSTGDPGLSGILATMNSDWSVVKTRLGFNNPDRYRTTFSLRNEKLRLTDDPSGDQAWKDMLAASTVSNILDDPDVKRYALQSANPGALTQPGIIIPFETSITGGNNFFGQPLAGGDHTFTPSSFATKIRSAGIAFKGYVGMDSPTTTNSTLTSLGATSPADPSTAFTDSNALSATPYVYLIPAGIDEMLAPPVSGVSTVRSWAVEDQAIPLPFNIGGTDFAQNPNFVSSDSLSEPEVTLRKQQAFRAVPDGTNFPSDPGFTNARLIGRSVWNTRWKIIIPGDTLLSDPQKGIQTFTNTVKDIKLHFETYSYSGN